MPATSETLDQLIAQIRIASRQMVRELGFMKPTLAETDLPPSAVHALVEIGAKGSTTSAELCDILSLEKSSVSRMIRKLINAGEIMEELSDRDGRVKLLGLTEKGKATLGAIDDFAQQQVMGALKNLPPLTHRMVVDGLTAYARGLAASRSKHSPELGSPDLAGIVIERGYRQGLVGRAVEMHARYYGGNFGFGCYFEAKVASGLAEFTGRLDYTGNGLWVAQRGGHIVGMVAIDGQDLGSNSAHLRWFVVEEGLRGHGIGQALLNEALRFCDEWGFSETRLWTFRALDAARSLYERQGFSLAEEKPGSQWGKEVIEQQFVRKRD